MSLALNARWHPKQAPSARRPSWPLQVLEGASRVRLSGCASRGPERGDGGSERQAAGSKRSGPIKLRPRRNINFYRSTRAETKLSLYRAIDRPNPAHLSRWPAALQAATC